MKLIYENHPDRYMFSAPADISFPKHMHTGLELFYVVDGEVLVTIADISRCLTSGCIAVAFPNQIHSYQTENNHNSSILILCPAAVGGDYMPELLKFHPVMPFLDAADVHADVVYALKALLCTPADNYPVIKAYIQLILARLLPELLLEKNHTSNPLSLTERIISYMSDFFTEPVSLNILAKHFGISKYTVSRIFNEKLHTSFHDYLNMLRVDYAKILLHGSDKDILSISMMCGYDSLRTFNRAFMKICGCQPREYRKK